jgi:hypothetical protein
MYPRDLVKGYGVGPKHLVYKKLVDDLRERIEELEEETCRT